MYVLAKRYGPEQLNLFAGQPILAKRLGQQRNACLFLIVNLDLNPYRFVILYPLHQLDIAGRFVLQQPIDVIFNIGTTHLSYREQPLFTLQFKRWEFVSLILTQ